MRDRDYALAYYCAPPWCLTPKQVLSDFTYRDFRIMRVAAAYSQLAADWYHKTHGNDN